MGGAEATSSGDLRFREYGIILPPGNDEEVWVRCPRCADDRKKKNTKSLHVNRRKGAWNCKHIHCEWKGGLRNGKHHKPKVKAMKSFHRKTPKISDEWVAWCEKRGISKATLTLEHVSSGTHYLSGPGKDCDCIQFPYMLNNKCVNVKYRDREKSFQLEKGGTLVFYRLDSIKEEQPIIITEGEMDALSCVEAGMENVVSVPNGAEATRMEYLEEEREMEKIARLVSEINAYGYNPHTQ